MASTNIYDVPRNLFQQLGSFWADTYESPDEVLAYTRALCESGKQTLLDVAELIATLSRYKVPIYHRERWALVRMLESDRNGPKTNTPRYGDEGLKFDGRAAFGQAVPGRGFSFPLPPQLREGQTIVNRFVGPTLVWTAGQDFEIDVARNALTFRLDPFADVRVATRPVFEDGVQVDREAVLWIFNADFDFMTAYLQFGYAVDLQTTASSRSYRNLMNAVYDALIGGGTGFDLDRALSAVTGVPLVLEREETVEHINKQQGELLICTNQHVYKFAECSEPLVAVGDVVRRGDALTDAVRINLFNRGETPEDLRGLAVGEGFLATCYYSDLVFENREYPLTVITDDPSGFTRVAFPLGGFPADVERFFEDVHVRGVVQATIVDECYTGPVVIYPPDDCDETEIRRKRGTMAHFLDVRANPVGEPNAASLPKKINPLQFLIRNVYRNNVFLVRIRADLIGRGALGTHQLRLLRRMIPPSQAMIVLVETSPTAETIDAGQITEEIGTFQGLELAVDEVQGVLIDDHRAALRSISFTCR